jgi:dipeptide transport system substrate-binding protein
MSLKIHSIAAALLVLILTNSMHMAAASTLVYCSEGSPETFNPQLSTSGTTFDASSRQIYNRLVEFKPGTTEIVPGLALRWDISKDGLEYTFHLRQKVSFHNTEYFTPGRYFNADDVLFSLNRQRNKSDPWHKVSGGVYKYFNDMGLSNLIKDVIKLDEHMVKVILNHPDSTFLSNMAMDFASILSKEYADVMMKEGSPEMLDIKPVGTGPFMFVKYEKDAFIRYQAHPAYWRGKEKLDKLVFAITVDPSVRYARLRTGECQVMAYPLPTDILSMKKNPAITVDEQPGLNTAYWAFNVRKPPFDKARVRQAMNYAINRQAILDVIYQGTGTKASSLIPPTIWEWKGIDNDYDYNPNRAKKLLADGGYPEGFEIDIWAMPVQRPYNPNARKMAELMQQDLKKIGVNANIVTYEWGTYLKKSRQGEHQTILLGWTGDNGDPDNFFTPLLSCAASETGNNRSFWCNKRFDDLISLARIELDKQKRKKLYRLAEVIFKQDAPWLTIAHSVRYQPYLKNVQGLKIDPFGGIYFSGVSLK